MKLTPIRLNSVALSVRRFSRGASHPQGGLRIFRPRSLLFYHPLSPEMESNQDGHCDDDHGPCADESVVADRIRGRAPEVVRDKRDGNRPRDSARGVPEEEAPPFHAREAGYPRASDAEAAEPAREEDRLAAVFLEEPLRSGKHARAETPDDPVALEEAAAELAPEPVADVVADDRRRGGDSDDRRNRVMPLRREHGGCHERRLARQREPGRLERNQEEDDRKAVLVDEVRHRATVSQQLVGAP